MRGGRWLALAGAIALVPLGCKANGVFVCSESAECTGEGVAGACEPEGLCSFSDGSCASGRRFGEFAGDRSGECVDGVSPLIDAAIEPTPDAVAACTPGESICAGHVLGTCNETGTGLDPSLDVACSLTCSGGRCLTASNLPSTFTDACGETAPALEPPPGADISIEAPGGQVRIACSPHCGDGTTTRIESTDLGAVSAVCLSRLSLPAGVVLDQVRPIDDAIVLFVHGSASFAGDIDVSGANAAGNNGGVGGPGGGDGVNLGAGAGQAGTGPCPGGGGTAVGTGSAKAAGGGGGGGLGGTGGGGGTGRSETGGNTAAGGAGAGLCLDPALSPLGGGSGGGSGSDGSCTGSCGWPSGGGGGALQISSRVSIAITGDIDASGGDGRGFTTGNGSRGGGGGGGSGGGILLEAPVVTVTGILDVEGGNGGPGGGGAGGAGASGAVSSGEAGPDFAANADGGGGGGGGGGRVRINAETGSCTNVSPVALCSAGPL